MKVLYWGYRENTPITYFRAFQAGPYLPALGVEPVYLIRDDFALGAIEWADVVVFRGWYDDTVTEQAWDHAAGRAARIYDTDDASLETPAHFPFYAEIMGQRDLIVRMASEADLVTTATPVLAGRYAQYARRPPIVVRNAVDMALYAPTTAKPERPLTALFYGPDGRLLDYFGYTDAKGHRYPGHAAAAVADARLRAMWIGCEGSHAPRAFDVVIPYDWDMLRFFRTLGDSHADIGVAPLAETSFNAAKSELHWLDMTAAGIPVVAQRLPGDGPYNLIRDGVDGLKAYGAASWREAVRRLAREPRLRADLVAAARERVATEYDPAIRASEWADAFRLAQE